MNNGTPNIKTILPPVKKQNCRRDSKASTNPSESEIRNCIANAANWIAEHGLPFVMSGRAPMVMQQTCTVRQLAEIAQVSIRQMERFLVAKRDGIPELMAAMLAEPNSGKYIALGPAERIARLPQDEQLDALNAFLVGKATPKKREPRTVNTVLERIAEIINSSCDEWSQADRQKARLVLCDYGRQLTGEGDDGSAVQA